MNNNYKSSYLDGNISENIFVNVAKNNGFTVQESSKYDNIYNHIDFYLKKGELKISFDVKGQKRKNRKDKEKSNQIIWIELKNVLGKKGWLYGKQDYIAFEFKDNFTIVKTEHLKNYIQSTINFDLPYVKNPDMAYKRLYQRKNRKDLITIIKKIDLLTIPHRIWVKNIHKNQ